MVGNGHLMIRDILRLTRRITMLNTGLLSTGTMTDIEQQATVSLRTTDNDTLPDSSAPKHSPTGLIQLLVFTYAVLLMVVFDNIMLTECFDNIISHNPIGTAVLLSLQLLMLGLAAGYWYSSVWAHSCLYVMFLILTYGQYFLFSCCLTFHFQ